MCKTYLIYGSNYELVKREIDLLIKESQDVVRYNLTETKIDELLDDASCMSMFEGDKIIIGENALFLTSITCDIKHNIDYLSSYLNDEHHDNIVIISVISDKLDERKKIVKLFMEKAKVIHKEEIDVKKLNTFVIEEFKNNGYSISTKDANYFVSYVGKNVDIIISEINKMMIYKDNDKNITKDDIDNVSSKAYKDNIFDLLDAVMKKDFKNIIECYNDLKIINMDSSKIIATLASQISLIYQVKVLAEDYKSQKEIANILKIHPYRVKLAEECDYMQNELTDCLKQLHQLDLRIKTGKVNKDSGLLDFFLTL